MVEKPIIFSAPMVRALLDGSKTQTRRVLDNKRAVMRDRSDALDCVRVHIGYRLWVRENWQGLTFGDYLPTNSRVCDLRYAATDALADAHRDVRGYPWRPSIHMPRWASRLTLTVTDVRVQRLQEISAADSLAEGVQCHTCKAMGQSACNRRGCFASIDAFRAIWDHINGPGAWAENPWVAAYTFTVHRCNIDQMPGVADG